MRVLVTRPLQDARTTAARLFARGHEAVIAPVTRIEPRSARISASRFQGLVATSAHALEFLTDDTILQLRDLPLFCVGARTREAALARGFPQTAPAAPDAEALLSGIPAPSAGARLLYLTGRDRKPVIEAGLARAGHAIEVAVVYAAVSAAALPEAAVEALRAAALDSALHYSRRGAAILVDLADKAGLAGGLARLAHVCISADAATPLRAMGAKVVVAQTPDSAGLFAALESL